jgi:hypothetical protein
MTPKHPFRAVSNLDYSGQDYWKSLQPRAEEDFSTLEEATAYLSANGGGYIERFHAGRYRRVVNVNPAENGDALALTA